jgi:hypothetical protein
LFMNRVIIQNVRPFATKTWYYHALVYQIGGTQR